MPPLTAEELGGFGEPTAPEVVPGQVARYRDLLALADRQPAAVIGEHALLRDRPGFEVDSLTRGSVPEVPAKTIAHDVLMPVRGHWRVRVGGRSDVLAPGDTLLAPAGSELSVAPSMTGEAGLYRVRGPGDPAGPTWRP